MSAKIISVIVSIFFISAQGYAAGADAMAKANGVVGIASATVSGYLAKIEMGECSGGSSKACAMAALYTAQAGASALAALQSFQTQKQIQGSDVNIPDNFDVNPGWVGDGGVPAEFKEQDWGPFDTAANFQKEMKNNAEELAKLGYKADLASETLTTPGGKKYPLSTLASGKSMADAGLIGPEDIAKVDAGLNAAKDKFKTISMAIAGGGGGGGSYGGSSASREYNDPFADYLKSKKLDVGKPKTEGLTRTIASGESIGAQTDNIFQMIRRRYEQKKQEFVFVP